jgi:NADH-quinone oxidoreductase subunit A
MNATAVVAYLALFATAGFLFVFGALLLGRFLRAHAPTAEKLETYECGEPTIGSSYIQFDLRFYVVALLFLIFDVEVSFFFPWAAVFGQATQLRRPGVNLLVAEGPAGSPAQLTVYAGQRLRALGVERPQVPDRSLGAAENERQIRQSADRLALVSMADVGVFFAVLLVGFAYVWKRGDLDWVRATEQQPAAPEVHLHEPPSARTIVS